VPQFLDEDVLVKELGENGKELYWKITSDMFDMDMELKEIAVTAFDNKQTTRQIFINLVTGILSSPIFQGIVNPVGTLVRLFQMFPEVTPNPEELLMKNPAVQQALVEYQRQKAQEQKQSDQLANGAAPAGEPGQPPAGMPPNIMPMSGIVEAGPTAGVAGQMGGM
jgi:hypothetical protein